MSLELWANFMLMNPRWWVVFRHAPSPPHRQRTIRRPYSEILEEIRRDVTLPASRANEIVDAAVALFRARQKARNGHSL